MRPTERGLVVGVCTLVLVVSTAGSAAALGPAAEQPRTASAPAAAADDVIVQTHRYALTPDRPGSVRVRLTYEIPDRVGSLRVRQAETATVVGTDGFDRANATTYEWDGRTAGPSVTFRYNPNETTSRSGPEAADGRYVFADAGEWALLKTFRTRTVWTAPRDAPTRVERRLRTAGPGVAGDRLVYLGPSRTVERTADGQTFRLVVPAAASLRESPPAILGALANASASLDIGDRDREVMAVAAPTGEVAWGVRGLAYGDSEFWVRDFERLDAPESVWLHEYVHTRQDFATTPETRWLTEGTAQYYAALLALEGGLIDVEAFRRQLAVGERERYDSVVLSAPRTWTTSADYHKGALAVGRLDASLRAATNRSASFEDALRTLNRREATGERPRLTQRAFLDAVAATGGADQRATAVEYTETPATLSVWDVSTHARLFGTDPGRIGYGLPTAADGYRASGPYRNATVTAAPIRLATGETLAVGAVVSNTGGELGAYNATLTVDGDPVASAVGTVEAESERTVRLAHTFPRAGEYTVGVGGETVPVVVEPAAEPAVSGLDVSPTQVRQGGTARVTATVRNDAAVPADGTVAFTRDGETVARRPVTLAPGSSTRVSATVAFPATGERQVGAGSATAAVRVRAASERPTGGSGAGFTAAIAVLAVFVTLLAGRASR